MAQKKIVWTDTAARQRRFIFEYWLQRNQSNEYPLKLLRLSNEKGNQIAANPMLYKAADFPNMRVAAMGHFSLFASLMASIAWSAKINSIHNFWEAWASSLTNLH